AAKRLLIEEDFRSQTKRAVQSLGDIFGVAGHIDAELFDHSLCHRAIWRRALDRERSPKPQLHASRGMKLVPLCVPAKVVVIFYDEYLRVRTGNSAEEVRSRQSTDTATYDNQVVGLTCIDRLSGLLPEFAIPDLVRGFERSH